MREMRWAAWMCLALAACSGAAAADRASTAGPTVRVFTPPLAWRATGGARTLRVYLPPAYARGGTRYPVIYMFDGQNLFDAATSYAGEWGVDEAMDALARARGPVAIVVGVDHGDAQRLHELTPFSNWRLAPNRGAAFADDLVHVVKPFVDANYRTLGDRGHTAVFGSSLGGLEAHYTIQRFPDVFGLAGVFSPSYWVSEAAYAQTARTRLPGGTRLYLYIGGREGETALPDTRRMAELLRARLADPGDVALRVVEDAEHNETAWRAEFPRAVRWLFDPRPRTRGMPDYLIVGR